MAVFFHVSLVIVHEQIYQIILEHKITNAINKVTNITYK